MNLGSWLHSAKFQLDEAGIASPALDAQLLAGLAFCQERSAILAHPEWLTPPGLDELLLRRLAGEPLAYILGEREFYGRMFKVSPAVLIPRQDTETLIEAWFTLEEKLPHEAKVLDLGTGSGCIGITLKLERPSLDVTLSDISKPALETATSNAADLRARVGLVESDTFQAFSNEKFDAIVTNPPYIGVHEVLDREVRDFEPKNALFSGETGLEMYDKLADEAKAHLNTGGIFIAEVGYSQGSKVRSIFELNGWNLVASYPDLSGIERALAFTVPEATQLVLES
ncbi:MAG TPA: peptide chain release factor N(5)-glutamine methyltransferase [Fimbriimonadaceae bacterium]|jgi:release factor glutamine methyltransferase